MARFRFWLSLAPLALALLLAADVTAASGSPTNNERENDCTADANGNIRCTPPHDPGNPSPRAWRVRHEWNSPVPDASSAPRKRWLDAGYRQEEGADGVFAEVFPDVFVNAPTSHGDKRDETPVVNDRIDFVVDGVSTGAAVRVDVYLQTGEAEEIGADSVLLHSHLLTDGDPPTVAGRVNFNIPGDTASTSAGADGFIVAAQNAYDRDLTLIEGTYRVRFSSPDGAFAPLEDTFVVESPQVYAQRFVGTVQDETGTSAGGAVVALLSSSGDRFGFRYGTVADADGDYRLAAPAGEHWLVALKPGYVASLGRTPRFPLPAGGDRQTDLKLTAGSIRLEGRVADASQPEHGLAGVRVVFMDTAAQFAVAVTDAEGNYAIKLTPGTWFATPQLEALMPMGYLATPSQQQIALSPDEEAARLDFALVAGSSLLEGIVRDSTSGEPLVGARLLGLNRATGRTSMAVSDLDGVFQMAVEPGPWRVHLTFDSVSDLALGVSRNVLVQPNSTQVLTFDSVSPSHFIDGVVLDAQNEPLVGVAIVAREVVDPTGAPEPAYFLPQRYATALSDEAGHYSLPSAPGTWQVSVASTPAETEGLLPFYPTVRIAPDDPQVVFQDLPFQTSAYEVPVIVQTAEGAPLADMLVELESQAAPGELAHSSAARTGADGLALLPAFPGEWRMKVFGLAESGYAQPAPRALILNADAEQPVVAVETRRARSGALAVAVDGDALRLQLEDAEPLRETVLSASADLEVFSAFDIVTPDATGTASLRLPLEELQTPAYFRSEAQPTASRP